MVDCAYCDRPLICDACRTPYKPANREQYEALSQREAGLACNECGTVLVCRWCKTGYEGLVTEGEEVDAPARR